MGADGAVLLGKLALVMPSLPWMVGSFAARPPCCALLSWDLGAYPAPTMLCCSVVALFSGTDCSTFIVGVLFVMDCVILLVG